MIIEIIALCILMLLVVFLLWNTIYLLLKTIRSTKWVVTQATMQQVDLKRFKVYDSDSKSYKNSNSVEIHYTYDYKGALFSNDKLYFKDLYTQNMKSNERIYARLKDAKIVNAYVNPKNPSESVLVRSLIFPIILLLTFGIFWFLLSLKLIDKICATGLFTSMHDQITLGFFISIFIIGLLSLFEKIQNSVKILETK